MTDNIKQIKNWLIFSLVVILSLWTFVYAADILTVWSWNTLTATKFNELVDQINLNSSKGWIVMLDAPIYAVWSWNWSAWVTDTTLDLNSLSWVTVPVWATYAMISAWTASYTSANANFQVFINWFVLSWQNWNGAWNKVDYSSWMFKLSWTSIDYELYKDSTSWAAYFYVTWFVVN